MFLVVKVFPQDWHLKGLALWDTICLARLLELLWHSPQMGQMCSSLYSWKVSWAASLPRVGKFLPQVVQMNLSSTMLDLFVGTTLVFLLGGGEGNLAAFATTGFSFSAFSETVVRGSQVNTGRRSLALSGS